MSQELKKSEIIGEPLTSTNEVAPGTSIGNDTARDAEGKDTDLDAGYVADLDAHPYAIASRLDEEKLRQRAITRGPGNELEQVEFSRSVVSRGGNFYGIESLNESLGAITEVISSNRTNEYRLTVGTCGQLAPAWISKGHHDRPMWVLHCPDLPVSHIEGCCFFGGLSSNELNTRNYTREHDTIGISYLVWKLAKREEILARVNPYLLDSLCNADGREGNVVVAYVGSESCTLTCMDIPDGLTDFLIGYEMTFEKRRALTSEKDIATVREAEKSILAELESCSTDLKQCSVHKWPTE